MANPRAQVRRSPSRSSPLDAAREAFNLAKYDLSRNLVEAGGRDDAGRSALLRAEIAHAESDFETAHAQAALAAREVREAAERATALALGAEAARRLGRGREAKTLATEAEREVARLTPLAAADARSYLAQGALASGDVSTAESLLRENVRAGAREAFAFAMLGWVEIERGRYAEAGSQFDKALRKLATAAEPDTLSEVRALVGLAAVAVETIDVRAFERVRKGAAKIEWPQALRAERFELLSALRYASLLEGDVPAAFFEAREAVAIAPCPAFAARGEVAAAVMSRLIGDTAAEKLQLGRAWAILRTERESTSPVAIREALLDFIAEGAGVLPADARKASTLYRALGTKGDDAGGDRREVAFEALAAARLAEAVGDDAAAERQYERSIAAFTALGFEMRAALVALDLRRLTGDDAYTRPVKSALSRAPKAWFGEILRAADGPLEYLSRAELVVLAHLLRGDTAKAIAEKLDRSPFTISNHTRKIFAAFETNSRAKVIAQCVDLKITPEKVERLAR